MGLLFFDDQHNRTERPLSPSPTAQELYRLKDSVRSVRVQAHVLLFSVSDRSSFEAITAEHPLLQALTALNAPDSESDSKEQQSTPASAATPIFLVANKVDLRSASSSSSTAAPTASAAATTSAAASASTSAASAAVVTRAEGLLKAKALGMHYAECSALHQVVSVVDVVRQIVYCEIERWQNMEEQWAKAHSQS